MWRNEAVAVIWQTGNGTHWVSGTSNGTLLVKTSVSVTNWSRGSYEGLEQPLKCLSSAKIFFSMSMWLAGVDVNEYCHHKQHANGSITFFLNNVSSCDEYSWLSDGTVVATDDNGNTSLVQHWECFNIIFKTCQPNVTFKTSCTVNIISCPYDCPTESGNANLHLNTTTLGPQKYGGFGVWSIVAVAVTVAIAIAVVFILWTRKKRCSSSF